MFSILLYHGTTSNNGHKIETEGIQLTYSKPFLDFAKGFYTTPSMEFALRTAKRRYSTSKHFPKLYNNISGIAVVVLEYDEELGRKLLRCKHFNEPNNRWARFIAANRVEADDSIWFNYDNNRLQQYDIVSGPTADGTFLLTEMLEKISKGKLSISEVKKEMCMPSQDANWGSQVSFHTLKALTCIRIKNVAYYNMEEE